MPTARTSHRALLFLVLLAVALTVALILPFATPLFLAAVLAGALMPAEDWLSRHLRGRRTFAATLLMLAVLFALLLPAGGLVAFLVREVLAGIQFVTQTLQSGGTEALIEKLPRALQDWARDLVNALSKVTSTSEGSIEKMLTTRGGQAVAAVSGLFAWTGTALNLVLESVLMLVALEFLLIDGKRLISWLESVSPLRPGQARELLAEFRRVSVAVLRSTLLTALVQSVIATIGYFIARAPQPVFFGLLTFIIALIPALGAAAGCIAVALLVLATGHPLAALFLFIWAVAVVGLVDNVVKPLFIKGGFDIHGAVIFFALFGGLAVFGPIGLIAGPLVVSFLLAVLRLWKREQEAETHPAVRPLDRAVELSGTGSRVRSLDDSLHA